MHNLDAGPAGLFFCWQALVLALFVYAVTETVKRGMDAGLGKERRKRSRWLTIFLLPVLPLVLGAFLAIFTPLRPEWLDAYVVKWPGKRWTVFGAWGACVGQFSDYAYHKVRSIVRARTEGLESPAASAGSVLPPSSSG